MKSFDLNFLFRRIEEDGHGGGNIDTAIPRSEVEFYAARLLAVGTDVIKSPPELIEAMRRKVQAIAKLYPQDPSSETTARAKN